MAELTALASKVDEEALIQRARQLSGGKACHLDPSDPLGRRLMGGMHVHRELVFDDGTVWLLRMLRENYTSFDDATSNQILLSECATLQWLETHVESIPAPRLHDFGLRGDASNEVGVAYMLIDKLPGKPFDTHSATAKQTAKVLEQWAGMLCELGRHPLDKVGSLEFKSASGRGPIVLGPVAGDRTGTLPCSLGPFSDARSFYIAWADTHLDLIRDGQLFSQHPVDAYLIFRWIKEQVAASDENNAGGWPPEWQSLHDGPFFLRHVDDKGDHLLVDDDYNITDVIDWTFARTAPAYEAFAPALLDDDAWEQSVTDEVEALLSLVNIPALERRASALRNGVACQFRRGKHLGDESTMGCANYNAWIDFADGVQWLARIPRTTDGSDVPADLVAYLVTSEYATLRFIEQHMPKVRAPRAYGYGLAGDPDNEVGVAYLLEEVLPGRPFQAYEATPELKQHVYRQYAEILTELSHHPVKQACSLIPGEGNEVNEGPIASDRFVRLSQHGPYPDALSYFSSFAEQHLDLISDGQIYPDYPLEAFVFYRLLRDRAAPVLASLSEALPLQGFFLKHVDDKGDHILVDEDFNITGIIDWQFARFVPFVEAFGPSLFTADMGNLYGGKVGLSADDKFMATLLRKICGEAAASTELTRRFHFGLASGLSKDQVLSMLGAVLRLLNIDHKNVSEWAAEEWIKAKEDNDTRWQQIKDGLNLEVDVS
ncbi:hypothetical protein SEUCBS140593_007655 [Sporothrix eucalyptigena]|uniref:Aminoglycoside phosphotransferase domain-containing protein n=1 Tax=Sporothrix eucalyptigena TaxID=1812306 RepID=A0ABP0CF16_9PEZI